MLNNKNILRDWSLSFLGISLGIIGSFLYHHSDGDKVSNFVSYILLAIGCGIFGHYINIIINYYSRKNIEELEKQMKIDKKDERNIMIIEKSKSKAFDLMKYLFVVILIVFSLIGVEKWVIIMMLTIYISIKICVLYWCSKYNSLI